MKFKVDIFSKLMEHELFVLDKVIEELERLAKNRGKDGIAARVSLHLIKDRGVMILDVDKLTDDALILYGKSGYAIATQDGKLKRKLKRERVKLIYLKQKKYVMVE